MISAADLRLSTSRPNGRRRGHCGPGRNRAAPADQLRWRPAALIGVLAVLLAGCWAPAGSLDEAMEATAFSGTIQVRGWVFDRDSTDPIPVHVYIDGSPVRAAMADQPRPDVAAAVTDAHGRTGFAVTVPAAPGGHEVCVYGID